MPKVPEAPGRQVAPQPIASPFSAGGQIAARNVERSAAVVGQETRRGAGGLLRFAEDQRRKASTAALIEARGLSADVTNELLHGPDGAFSRKRKDALDVAPQYYDKLIEAHKKIETDIGDERTRLRFSQMAQTDAIQFRAALERYESDELSKHRVESLSVGREKQRMLAVQSMALGTPEGRAIGESALDESLAMIQAFGEEEDLGKDWIEKHQQDEMQAVYGAAIDTLFSKNTPESELAAIAMFEDESINKIFDETQRPGLEASVAAAKLDVRVTANAARIAEKAGEAFDSEAHAVAYGELASITDGTELRETKARLDQWWENGRERLRLESSERFNRVDLLVRDPETGGTTAVIPRNDWAAMSVGERNTAELVASNVRTGRQVTTNRARKYRTWDALSPDAKVARGEAGNLVQTYGSYVSDDDIKRMVEEWKGLRDDKQRASSKGDWSWLSNDELWAQIIDDPDSGWNLGDDDHVAALERAKSVLQTRSAAIAAARGGRKVVSTEFEELARELLLKIKLSGLNRQGMGLDLAREESLAVAKLGLGEFRGVSPEQMAKATVEFSAVPLRYIPALELELNSTDKDLVAHAYAQVMLENPDFALHKMRMDRVDDPSRPAATMSHIPDEWLNNYLTDWQAENPGTVPSHDQTFQAYEKWLAAGGGAVAP